MANAALCKHFIFSASLGNASEPSAFAVLGPTTFVHPRRSLEITGLRVRHLVGFDQEGGFTGMALRTRELMESPLIQDAEQAHEPDLLIGITAVESVVAALIADERFDFEHITVSTGGKDDTPDDEFLRLRSPRW